MCYTRFIFSVGIKQVINTTSMMAELVKVTKTLQNFQPDTRKLQVMFRILGQEEKRS